MYATVTGSQSVSHTHTYLTDDQHSGWVHFPCDGRESTNDGNSRTRIGLLNSFMTVWKLIYMLADSLFFEAPIAVLGSVQVTRELLD